MSAATASLRGRLIYRLLAPLLIVLLTSGAFTYWLSLYFANRVYDGWLYDSVNSLALLVDRNGDRATCDLPVAAEEIFVWDDTDSTFFSVSGDRSGVIESNASLPAVPADADHYREAVLYETETNGERVRIMALRLTPERAGEPVWVQVAETGQKRHRLAQAILLAVIAPQIVLIVAAGIAVWMGVVQGLMPLRLITQRLGSQSPSSLQPLSDRDVPVEVLPLTNAVNTLLADFHGVLSAQRKFIADAAHQLRTPLTAIKLNIDRALSEDDERARATLLRLRISAERATRLANQLLSMARVESTGRTLSQAEFVDLVRLTQESGAEWVPAALDKNVELSLQAPSRGVNVYGDPVLLREAIDNLLDNAIKYHPGDGHISISIVAGAVCKVIVEDDGPGIAVDLRERVFERFYRGDRSAHSGSGLGLPIVSEIATAHGGRVSLHDAENGRGLRAVIELPCSRLHGAP